jgi:hypothetical protein
MVLKQAMQAGQTLKVGQEKAKEDAELTAGEQAELDAAKKLAGLSGVSSKLGQIAEQRLAGAATGVAQRSFKASEVDKLANPLTQPTENASIKQALLDYANDPTKREAALVTLANAKIMPEQINSLLENVDTVLNRNVQTSALAGTDIESAIQELGYSNLDDLAATLGRPTGSLAAMTLPEIQSAIEQKRQELTSRKAAVQTKAAGAGLGAAAAQQDIARFTKAGGLAQTEEAARPTIDFKAKIKLGDQDYDIETILKDEEFSNVIEQWLDASPADRAKLIPESWPLTAWLNANETSLKQSEAEGAAAGKQLMAAQSQVANLKDLSQDVLTAFVPGYEKGKIYSEAELASMKSAWESSAAFGLDMGFLNKLKADEIAMIKDGSVSKSDLSLCKTLGLHPASHFITQPI